MNDSDKIPQADILLVLPRYKGEYGWPTYGDFKPLFPDYYWSAQVKQGGWEPWDNPNKSSVILEWHGRQVSIEAQKKWLAESNEISRRIAEEEKRKQELAEEQRLVRLAKQRASQEDETARKQRADKIHAEQMEANRRKLDAEKSKREEQVVNELIEQANEYITSVNKLVAALRRIPDNRLHEVDTDSLFFNCGRVKSIVESGHDND